MKPFTALDVVNCPLKGINLIEASAGTGKTWTICALYLRLLIEHGLTVDQILVVTFTNAATAELRERIRRRLLETLAFLRSEEPANAAGDGFIATWLDHFEAQGMLRSTMIGRLELALETFDQAAILTIHGFCQRSLAEMPFAASLPFDVELIKDDAELIQQAANDFWRQHVAVSEPESAGPALELPGYLMRMQDDPGKYAGLLKRALAKPLARRVWPDDEFAEEPGVGALSLVESFAAAQRLWQGETDVIAFLKTAASALDGRTYKPDPIEKGGRDWSDCFSARSASEAALILTEADRKADLYRTRRLIKGTRKGHNTPSHAFFDAAETLYRACERHQKSLQRGRLRLLRSLIEDVPDELRKRKQEARLIAFDDMLFNLHRALTAQDRPALAGLLRARYPAALIDEFQDTDPLQFEIFKALYESADGPLFMVGDPKQAIYGFRNADLHTYLRAQALTSARYTLNQNQRSSEGLIAACNALFGANPRAFVLPGIDYRRVERGRKPLPELVDRGSQVRSPLQVWLLPRMVDDLLVTRAEGILASSEAVAQEVSRLLVDGQHEHLMIADRVVRAGDIAVLVRSHREGALVRRSLAGRGVGSVELSKESVFCSIEAEELERVLLAISEPHDDRLLRAALATELLGVDANALDAMNSDEAAFYRWLERFSGHRALWERQGIAFMLRRLIRDENVQPRLLGLERGERRLTNLLHLVELLADASAEHNSVGSLMRWFGSQRRLAEAGEAAQLRLESDRNLVQIVTIHKSKGLEFPIVFCPFLWNIGHSAPRASIDCVEYHDAADGLAVLDFRPESCKDEAIRAARAQEASAETVRLIYVALTRAIHRCYLIASGGLAVSAGRTERSKVSRGLLNWLVCGADVAPHDWSASDLDPEAIERAWIDLGGRQAPSLGVAVLPAYQATHCPSTDRRTAMLAARPAPGPRIPSWNRSSFSGLIRQIVSEPPEVDHDLGLAEGETSPSVFAASPPVDDILMFPRGPAAGACIHYLFEHVDFAVDTDWPSAIEVALNRYPQDSRQSSRDRLKVQLAGMLRDVLATDLGRGFRLGDIGKADRLSELGFTMSARGLDARTLNAWLQEHGYPVGRLDFDTVHGYLSGAIDLVFRRGGRYYIVDWKSNHLGDACSHYAADRLADAMTEHAYRLQYLIYCAALQRFLRRRLADYDADQHFGGVYYLFIRGVRPGWTTPCGPAGVYFDRPGPAELDAFEALMEGLADRVAA